MQLDKTICFNSQFSSRFTNRKSGWFFTPDFLQNATKTCWVLNWLVSHSRSLPTVVHYSWKSFMKVLFVFPSFYVFPCLKYLASKKRHLYALQLFHTVNFYTRVEVQKLNHRLNFLKALTHPLFALQTVDYASGKILFVLKKLSKICQKNNNNINKTPCLSSCWPTKRAK